MTDNPNVNVLRTQLHVAGGLTYYQYLDSAVGACQGMLSGSSSLHVQAELTDTVLSRGLAASATTSYSYFAQNENL